MVPVMSLWLPILLSSALIFVVSSILHMFVQHHWRDLARFPNAQGLLDWLRSQGAQPGDYMVPKAETPAGMRAPEIRALIQRGPTALITVRGAGVGMGKSLAQWFIYHHHD
jgi:hypothetical protein